MSAVDTVRARITMAINLGLLLADERLPSSEEMARAFGVSRSSVIRGLTLLQQEGVVVRRAGRYGGSYIRGGEHHAADEPVQSFIDDTSTVRALIEERAVLEAGFAALAAERRSGAELEQLRGCVDRMARTDDWAEFRNTDRLFHRRVVDAARVPLAEPLVARINDALDPYFLPYSMGLLHESNEGHREILAALEAGDAGRAALLTAAHIRELHESMYVGLTGGARTEDAE
nr:FCD domain-containing protein [Leucobacter weissii]